jgi:hypothetical protein
LELLSIVGAAVDTVVVVGTVSVGTVFVGIVCVGTFGVEAPLKMLAFELFLLQPSGWELLSQLVI